MTHISSHIPFHRIAINSGNTNSGNYVAGTLPDPIREEVGPGTYNIPTGSFKGEVRNTGLIAITVNGKTVSPNGREPFEQVVDETTKTQHFNGPVTIVIPTGGSAWYEFRFLN